MQRIPAEPHGAAEIGPGLEADEARLRQSLLEPFARRSFADDKDRVTDLVTGEPVDRVGEDVEALLHDEPPDEADRGDLVRYS